MIQAEEELPHTSEELVSRTVWVESGGVGDVVSSHYQYLVSILCDAIIQRLITDHDTDILKLSNNIWVEKGTLSIMRSAMHCNMWRC